jgi:hypothetical protein
MLRTSLSFSALAAATLAATVGCSSIDSSDLETSGINASIEVVRLQNDGGVDVHASLAAGTLNFVDLEDGDVLSARLGDNTVTLEQSDFLGALSYNGHLDGGAAGDVVTVALTRAEKDSAPTSTVNLPELIEITAPAASAAFSRADDDIVVTVSGEESDVGARLSWSGDCVVTDGIDVPADQTTVTINRGTIVKREQVDENDPDSQPVPDSCTVTLTVRRTTAGALDAAYKGGSITGVTQSSRDITSNL